MRNVRRISAALVVASVCLSGAARAGDGEASSSPELQAPSASKPTPTQTIAPKYGLIVTGAVLVLAAGAHLVLGLMAIHSGDVSTDCSGGMGCYLGNIKSLDYEIGAASVAVGGLLAITGISLMVYGTSAKKSTSRGWIAVSPSGVAFAGRF